MKKVYFISLFSLLLVCFKCDDNKLLLQETLPFSLTDSHFQKFVPGDRNQKVYYEVSFVLSDLQEGYFLDSILWDQNAMSEFHNKAGRTIFSTAKVYSLRIQESNDKLKNSEMIVFYSKKNKTYFHHLNKVKELEPLILP